MWTQWAELAKRAVMALERIAGALEARAMTDRFSIEDGEGRRVPFVQAASFHVEHPELEEAHGR